MTMDLPASSFGLGPIGCVDSCHLLKAVVEAPVIGIRNMLYCLWRGQHDSPSLPRRVLISTGGVSHFRGMALFLPRRDKSRGMPHDTHRKSC